MSLSRSAGTPSKSLADTTRFQFHPINFAHLVNLVISLDLSCRNLQLFPRSHRRKLQETRLNDDGNSFFTYTGTYTQKTVEKLFKLQLVVGGQVSLFHHPLPNASAFQRFGIFSSVPPPENPEKEKYSPPGDGGSTTVENSGATAKASGDTEALERREAPRQKQVEILKLLREERRPFLKV